MVITLSASLRKLLLARSEEELARMAEAWGIYKVPVGGWLENFEVLGEQIQDPVSARFAWASLSPMAREVLHQIITNDVMDGMPHSDLQKLANLTDADFAAALQELEQRLMLLEDRPGAGARARMEMRGEKITRFLMVPKDFRALLSSIENEIYDPELDRSAMQLIEVLRTYGATKLQEITQLYEQPSHGGYYSYYSGAELARSLAGKLVQPSSIEYAWTRLEPAAQKLCRWLSQHEGKAELALARTELQLSNELLSKCLRQLESYGLAFDTFSGGKHTLFVGRGTYKVVRRVIEELDQLLAGEEHEVGGLTTLETLPAIVREAEGLALYDLAIVIGAVYQQVIEPTQAGYVPKRVANKIYPLLHTSRPDAYGDDDRYLDILFRSAQQLDLLMLLERAGQKARYAPGDELAAWASLEPAEQVRRLLELWWNPANYFWSDVAGVNFRPGQMGFAIEMRTARKALTQYLLTHCSPGEWYTLRSLLNSIKESNHLLLHTHPGYTSYGSNSSKQTRKAILAQWDQTDGEIIAGLLSSTLYEFGLVSLGYAQPFDQAHPDNPVAFKLTELAARVFQSKEARNGTNPVVNESKRGLIVQPNFELLLLQPDYVALYQLLPFTRVEQVEMVSRLTLTQESARRGVEAGWTIEHILEILQSFGQKELPQNVLYTLQDWGRLYKDATVSQILLIEVSSEAAADEICASAKFRTLNLRRLGPCAIAAGDQVSLQVLRTTLEKEGLIVRFQGDILTAREGASATAYYGKRR